LTAQKSNFNTVWFNFQTYIYHLSIFYNILCYNSLVLLTFVSRSNCRFTYIYTELYITRNVVKYG